uniref:1,4-dihydroxy-2-naphthoate octaprenyltransferase n=1 Tax=Chromulina nebulosa TaxID=96789 RepID=A0A7S0SXL2_9STRA|mmetsp:Transcript_4660/g.4172  ORF Transcript_4660/g.4172 Transcript_4660/m.4172 type:complete len:297 (+) Transcript_4660:75-965(+)
MTIKQQLEEYVLATRPWSFTAAIVPIIITAAVCKKSLFSIEFIRAMCMGITIQAGANLTNTYFDFINGVDSKINGEKTLVERKVSCTEVLVLSLICYLSGLFCILPYLITSKNLSLPVIFMVGVALAYFYTANPIGLKYKALGDVTIFLCFGPLLMQCTSILLVGSTTDDLYLYSIPVGLLTEEILHVNNARDIKADSLSGAITLATIVGPDISYLIFLALLIGSYLSIIIIGLIYHWGCLAALFTIPLALSLDKHYREGKMVDLPAETAQLHLPFGIILALGIALTESGLIALIQ